MNYGFVGLGNLGAKLVANLLRGGVSVKVFDLNQEAVEKAKSQGAEVALSVADAAAEVGYASEAAFSRVFKKQVGVSPAAYRALH